MKKYYLRYTPDWDPFYIDEDGKVVDEATAKTNLQEKSPRPKLGNLRITESLAEFDALLRRPALTEFDRQVKRRAELARAEHLRKAKLGEASAGNDQEEMVTAWMKLGLTEDEARIAADVENKIVTGWMKLGLTEEGARIAARVETDMRRSAKDLTNEDWAKLRW